MLPHERRRLLEIPRLVTPPVPRDGEDEILLIFEVEIDVHNLREQSSGVEAVLLALFDVEVGVLGADHDVQVVVQHVRQALHDLGHGEGIGKGFGEEFQHGDCLVGELHVGFRFALGSHEGFFLVGADGGFHGRRSRGREFLLEVVDFDEGGKRFVEHESDVVEEEVDEADEKVKVDFGFFRQMFAVDGVGPDALDDLEDLVADVEFVVELGVSAGVLDFDVEFHEGVEEVVRGER